MIIFRKGYNLEVTFMVLGGIFLFNSSVYAIDIPFHRETLRIPMTGSKRVASALPSNRALSYPTEGKKTQMAVRAINTDEIVSVLRTYSGIINQFTLTLMPTVILPEKAKRIIVQAAKEENTPLTIVQLEIGEKNRLTDTLFTFTVNQMGEEQKVLGKYEIMPLPQADSESVEGHIIYSDIIDVAKIDESEQDRLSAKAMLSQGDLKLLNYLSLGALASYYPNTIDFLIETINELAATGNLNVLDTLLHLQAITSDCSDNCVPQEKKLQEVFYQSIEKLKVSLDSGTKMLKNQQLLVAQKSLEKTLKQALAEVTGFVEKIRVFTQRNPIEVSVNDVDLMIQERDRVSNITEALTKELDLPMDRAFNLYSNISFLGTPLSAIKGSIENVDKAWAEVDRLSKTNFLETDAGAVLNVSAYEKEILEQAKSLPRKERRKIEKQIAMMKQSVAMEFSMTTQAKLQETKKEILTKKKDDVERFFAQINNRLSKIETALESLQNWQPTPIDQIIRSAKQTKDKV